MSMVIIDRRKNPKSKSLSNRRRFMDRVKKSIHESAKKAVGTRSINDTAGTRVKVRESGTSEPEFFYDGKSGHQDYVVNGNERYVVGDKIWKSGEENGGQGNQGGTGMVGEDEFEFAISYDEYLNVIFDGLELPNLVKEGGTSLILESQRSGYSTSGIPARLDILKTMQCGLSRKIALRNPKYEEISRLEEELERTDDPVRRKEIEEEIELLRIRANAVSFLDDIDLRFKNYQLVEKPVTQAVMFCIMDVSFSMSEAHKIMAKKFFLLLNRFLRRQYQHVEVVFIRHHETAKECDEITFFTERESGGTIVSTAYQVAKDIITQRYRREHWNIYISQVSDGDNYLNDTPECLDLLDKLLPMSQFMIYLEAAPAHTAWSFNLDLYKTELMNMFDPLAKANPEKLMVDRITDESQIVPSFRKMFAKRGESIEK